MQAHFTQPGMYVHVVDDPVKARELIYNPLAKAERAEDERLPGC